MRIKHHYCLKSRYRLIKFLDKFQIKYELDEEYKTYIFELYEDQDIFLKFRVQFPFLSRFGSWKTIEYSREDIENAEWLAIRSKSINVQWEYDEKAFHCLCPYKRLFIKEAYYRHLEQVDILSVAKQVKWGTRQFFSGPNTADNIIFCSERTKKILEKRWGGLEFWPVKYHKTSKYIKDLYQIVFIEYLPIEAFSGGILTRCSSCGRQIMRIIKGTHQLVINRKYLQNKKMVYQTGQVLTRKRIGFETFSLNIVPKEFYEYCERYGMNRGMVYEPIKLK